MKAEYKNQYGFLQIELTEDYKKVSLMSSKDYDTSLFFSIETAEKIALITSNEKIQCSCVFDEKILTNQMYLIYHLTGSLGAVCKVITLQFTSDINAEKELEKLNHYNFLKLNI